MNNLVPVLQNNFQRSYSGSQVQSSSLFFVHEDEQEYYDREQNYSFGDSGELYNEKWGIPQEFITIVENGDAVLEWQLDTDTQTWEAVESISIVMMDNKREVLFYSSFDVQR